MTKTFPAAGLALILLLVFSGAAVAHPGTGIAVDRQGRVYFTDLARVWRWEPGGRLTVVVEGKHSHAIRLDADGTLEGEHLTYESAGNRWWTSAWRRSPDGTVTDTAPPAEGFPFLFPPAVAPDGSRYYTRVDNNRRDISEIHRHGADGHTRILAGGAYGYADGIGREARFGPIGAVAVGPGGALYVTDDSAIRRVSPDGRVTTLARGGRLLKASVLDRLLGLGGRSGHLMGIAVDARGNAFVANHGLGRVVRVSPSGQVTGVLASKSPWAPSGVALAGNDLYVLEAGTLPGYLYSVRARRVGTDGTVTTLAVIHNGKPDPPASIGNNKPYRAPITNHKSQITNP